MILSASERLNDEPTRDRVGEVYYSSFYDEIFVIVLKSESFSSDKITLWECRSLEDAERKPFWQSDSSFDRGSCSRIA